VKVVGDQLHSLFWQITKLLLNLLKDRDKVASIPAEVRKYIIYLLLEIGFHGTLQTSYQKNLRL
jgi:hypothetical protein